jgi:16S rRNA processing protein RimM
VNLPTPPADLVELGRVAGAYGVRGWVRVRPHGRPDESALLSASEAWFRAAEGPGGREGAGAEWQRVEILDARPHSDQLLLRISGCDSRERAEQLKGSAIAASRASFPEPEPGEYYWIDLVGCEVVGQQGAILGRVLAVEDFGAPHPVLRVGGDDPRGRTLLIPFVAPIVADVDIAARRISADWAADY